jgi:hypothetical protein
MPAGPVSSLTPVTKATVPTFPVAAVTAPVLLPVKAPAPAVVKQTEVKKAMPLVPTAAQRAAAKKKVKRVLGTKTAPGNRGLHKGWFKQITEKLAAPSRTISLPKTGSLVKPTLATLSTKSFASATTAQPLVQSPPGPVSSLTPIVPGPSMPLPPEAYAGGGGGGGGGPSGPWSPDAPPEEGEEDAGPAPAAPELPAAAAAGMLSKVPKWALYAGGAAAIYFLFLRRRS